MAFDGYLRLNTVEIANAARTARYLENLLPTFGLVCPPCEGLEAALGDTYSTPVADNAPWYDPLMPASGAFYGFYPLSIEGIDDSTREAVTTELVGDGSITNRPRFAGRDIRVNGVLIGATEQAVDTGMAWLNRALSGPCDDTDDCLGGDLEFYSSCPQVQDWSQSPATVASMDPDFASEVELWSGSEGGSVTVVGTGIQFNGAVGEVFSRQVSGLIPGEPYRLRMRTGANTYQVTIPESADFHFAHHNLFAADLVYVVLDFIPLYDTITLQITPDSGLTVVIEDYDITRMPSFQTVLQTEYDSPGIPSGGWEHAALPAGLVGGWNFGATSGVRFDILATAAPTSYPIGSGPTRIINYPGPGRTRVTLQGTFDGPGNAVPITLSTNYGTETIIQEEHNQIGTTDAFYYILEYDRSAVAFPNQINLESGQAVTVTTTDDATWFINYLLVEQVDETITLEDPNPGLAFERTLRNVVATSGPTTVERFSPPCGAMRRVTFSLRAGVPFHYGTDQFVGNAFGSEATAMPEVECLDGDAAAVNYVTNPRFVTDAPWTMTTFTTLTPGISGFYPGLRHLEASGAAGLTAQLTADFTIPASIHTPTPGAPYVAGVFVETLNETDVTLSVQFNPTDPLSPSGSTTVTVPAATSPIPTLTPIVAQTYAPLGAASTTVRVTLDFVVAAGTVDTVNIAAPIVTFGMDLPSYSDDWTFGDVTPADFFTGASTNAAWFGTADDSMSVYTPAEEPIVYDPACPPLPDPPAPPTIDDDCLTLPADWTRYTIDVPSRFIPVTSSADPVATIVTTSVPVNNVRMRFYPADLGPFAACGFEGEMLISYIPMQSQVIVDATRRTATLVRAGFEDQSVTHLLYGPNGGPVQWPNLSCGTPYLFAVDVESGADVDTFQVLLDVAVRY
jgi:hypothetical protein